MPSVINIRKNIIDHPTEPGRVAIASGYTTNTRPGPTTDKQTDRYCCRLSKTLQNKKAETEVSRVSLLKRTRESLDGALCTTSLD